MEVLTGVVVKLAENAVYYKGERIPDWVKKDCWIVQSVAGDQAVLGANTSGTHSINSPVNTKYLIVQSNDRQSGTATPQQNQDNAPAETKCGGNMSISDRGVALIAKYEGCRLDAYLCPAGKWTIGYGHTAGVKPGDRLPTAEAALKLLKDDLKVYGNYVNDCVKKGLIAFPLTQNQFDALTSFCYNCGNGNLKKLVSGRDANTIGEKILLYDKGGGKVLAGLSRRRKEERALFQQ